MPKWSRYAPAVEAVSGLIGFAQHRLAPLLDLLIRLWLASIFFASGVIKVSSWTTAILLYTEEHPVPGLDPHLAAVIGTGIELICPILLAVGLMTRLAAIPLLLTTAFLQLTYKDLEIHLYWMLLLGYLVVRGAGAISLDHRIGPHLHKVPLPFARALTVLADGLSCYAWPVYAVLLRLWMAELFFASGLTKIASFEFTVLLFANEYQVPLLPPDVAAVLATATELTAPVLLAIGLFGRLAALPLIVMTAVIQLTYLQLDEHYLWMMVLGILALRGPGALSVDGLLKRAVMRLFPSHADDTAWLADAPRVVVVGAGFGGLAVTQALRHAWARVTLVDRRNYHLFQPLLYQVATAGLSPADIATPIRTLLRGQPNAEVILGRVTGVDTQAREVILPDRRLPYDYLVLATGARHSYFGKDEWETVAPGLKKIDDATQMRRRLLLAFEQAETAAQPEDRRRLLTFVIVGAGPTGVELAGAIAELAHHGMEREFRHIDPATARVILVQSGPRVLPAMPEPLSARAEASLKALGVEIRLNSRVLGIDDHGVVIGNERIDAGTVFWAAGVMASPAAKWLGAAASGSGHVVVAGDLSVPACEGVYAVGDTSACTGPDGKPLPGLAPVAKQQGEYVGRLLRARIEGRTRPGPFRYRDLGSMATIGRKAAVAALPGLQLSGAVAWWLWGLVHVAFLVDVRSRIAVMLDWFWSYLTYGRRIRLITGPEA